MLKEVPQNELVEKTIIGLALFYGNKSYEILTRLNENDFYANNFRQKEIFKAMLDLIDQKKQINVAGVVQILQQNKKLAQIGGVEFLYELTEMAGDISTADYYINILQETTLLRNFLLSINNMINDYEKNGVKSIPDFIGTCESKIRDITSQRKVSGFDSLNNLSRVIGNKLQTSYGSQDTITGTTTGFSNLDRKINGLNPGQLIILAARPAMGKSALGMNIAYLNALKTGKPVAVFSYEMDGKELTNRLIANRASVPQNHIINGFLTKEERLKISGAVEEMQHVQLFIDQSSATTIDEIFLQCRKLKEEKGEIGLVVVDYIGIIKEGAKKFSSEHEKVGYFSNRLKELARELNVPVLCLAQINRAGEENNDNKIPQMSNLRSSGQIEADADIVMMIYRDSYYKRIGSKTDKKDKVEGEAKPLDTAIQKTSGEMGDPTQIIIAKNRSGNTGYINLLFFGAYARFDEPDPETERLMKRLDS